jgi:hypothetical protein
LCPGTRSSALPAPFLPPGGAETGRRPSNRPR